VVSVVRHLKLITFHVPEKMLEQIKVMLDLRLYPNRSELIRVALRDMLKREGMWGHTRTVEFPKGTPLDEIQHKRPFRRPLDEIDNEVEQHGKDRSE